MAGNTVDLSPGSIKELATAVASSINGGSGSSSSAPKSSGMSGFNWLSNLKSAAETTTDGIVALGKGSVNTATLMGQAGQILSKIDPTGLTKPLVALGDAGVGTIQNINKAGREIGGLDFAGDAGRMNAGAKNMMLTQEQMIELYKKQNGALNGLGPTVNRSAQVFNKLGEDFSKTTISNQLAALGINMEEQAELQAEYLANNRFLNLQDADQRAKTIQSFGNFVQQLDENSRLTGMSKKAQTDAINEQAKNVRVMAAVSQLGPQAMENFKGMQGQIVGLGQNVQMAASAIYTGGPKNEQERAAIAAMGPAAAQFEKAVKMSKDAGDDPAKKAAAEQQMQIAREQIIAWQRSKAYTDAVQTGQGAVADAMRAQYEQNKYGPAAQFMANQAENKGKSQAELSDQQRKIAEQEKLRIDERGRPLAGSQTSIATNLTDKALLNVAAGTTGQFVKLNDALGESEKLHRSINGLMRAAGSEGRDTVQQGADKVVNKVSSMIPGTEDNAAASSASKGAMDKLKAARQHRDFGTWGVTGQMFEPMDQIVKISKGEIVLDPQQAKSFVAGMGNSQQQAPASSPAPTPATPPVSSKEASLSDVADLLKSLNMHMGELVAHSSSTAEYAKKQVSAIKSASGNMWA